MRCLSAFGPLLALASALLTSNAATAQEPSPSFEALEAAGARIGEIRVIALDIFDTTDPREDKRLFRWANALHIQTRPYVIERALLFKSGEPLSVRLIQESERVLRTNRYLYDVQFRPAAYHDGVVDIEVLTRDTWSLDPGISAGRSGGANTSGFHLNEYNLLGTGVSFGIGRSKSVDRTSTELKLADNHAFGTWTAVSLSHELNSDGKRDAVSVERPFYALDARWAAGVKATKDDRIDPIYNAGNVVSESRHRQTEAEVFGGWSQGLVDGWVQRYSVGASLLDNNFLPEPGRVAPAALPPDEKLVGPFVRYELIEDRFERLLNRNLIGRPEFFALGFASMIQLGWAGTTFGSTHDALLYTAAVSRGFEPAPDDILTMVAKVVGQYAGGQARQQHLAAQVKYYVPQGKRWLFYAAGSADVLTNPTPVDFLLLGGDNGLRGYPLRYQSGTRSALFTVEERGYTDLYPFRLFRIGGAAFVDVGRAWGGSNTNLANPGWLANVGFGLRIVNARSAFSNVLHMDVAFPLNATPDVKKVQFIVKTKLTF
jgi:hypothetical protein